MLEIINVSVKMDNKTIVDDVSFTLSENDILMVIGPNGAGKSTLIRAIMQFYPYDGRILLKGNDISDIGAKELAKLIGVLTQRHQLQFSQTVYEIVSLGRYAYQKAFFGNLSKTDKDKIEEALFLTGIEKMACRSVLTLSGGELQRVFLAQLLAQDPELLILDEPANHLDLKYQIAIFDIIKKWAKTKGKAVMAVIHDLNTVFSYGTKAVLMSKGRVYNCGEVKKVLSPENLQEVYQVDVSQWMRSLLDHWR